MYLGFQVKDKTAKLITGNIESLKGKEGKLIPPFSLKYRNLGVVYELLRG